MQVEAAMIAPCGLNCALCVAHQRKNNRCPGCNAEDAQKPPTRVVCRIKICDERVKSPSGLCCDCDSFPCLHLKKLDKRYSTKYGVSVIENYRLIKSGGMAGFLASEAKKWTCGECGGLKCMHRGGACLRCDGK